MPESAPATTDLTSQYAAQVAADLERNTAEQERISADIAALQQQLAALQHDHAVLLTMQQALGTVPAAAVTAVDPGTTTVPAPREDAAPSGTQRRTRTKKGTGAKGRAAERKPAARKTAAKTATGTKAATGKPDRPTLVELVRRHLTEQGEPRSAAEIATALDRAHPERGIKVTVVRTTVEGLVARNQAQRTKQGTSVYYTAPEASRETPASASGPAGDGSDQAG